MQWRINRPRGPEAVFLCLAALFLLNDFVFIVFDGSPAVYIADILWRLLVIAIIAAPFARKHAMEPDAPCESIPFITVLSVAAFLTCYIIATWGAAWLQSAFGAAQLFRYPVIEDMTLKWLDLTIGLLLVAVAEELVFRRLAWKTLAARGFSTVGIVFWSSLIFGVIHWATGLASVVSAGFTGVILMLLYRYSGRLWPCVLVHWAINFAIFS